MTKTQTTPSDTAAKSIAVAMQESLSTVLGWECGPVEIQANGEIGFWVVQPATVRGKGRKAVTIPSHKQIRTFSSSGAMLVTVAS